MIKLALTHDVDRVYKTYQYITHCLRALSKKNFDNAIYHLSSIFQNNPYWCFEDIIKLENEYSIKSTFFFLNESLKFSIPNISDSKLSLGRYNILENKIMELIRYLDNNGWEIGVHGSFNSYQNYELLKKERETLSKIVNHEIIGIRQHYLNLTNETWKLQSSAGYKYDSSFGYTNNIGFKENKFKYFTPFKDEFIVFPLIIMDSCFCETANNFDKLNRIFELAQENDSLIILNWHTHVFNEKEFPGYKIALLRIIEEALNQGAKFLKLENYYYSIVKEKGKHEK